MTTKNAEQHPRSVNRSGVVNVTNYCRVLIADDHEVAREGLRAFLDSLPETEICGEAKTGSDAVRLAIKTKPDIVILDLSLPELNGVDVVRAIRTILPKTEVLVVSLHLSPEIATVALRAGARGYVAKSDTRGELISAVQRVRRRKLHLSKRLAIKLRGETKKIIGRNAVPDHTLTPEHVASVLIRSEMQLHNTAVAMLCPRRSV
jgi:DNA-binding NarL/FixJ family response regulator